MRVMSLLAAAILVSTAALPALADPPAATPTTTTPTAQAPAAAGKRQPKPDDMICEEDAAVTGSMLSHRVCKTRAQREAETAAGQDALRNNAHLIPGAGHR